MATAKKKIEETKEVAPVQQAQVPAAPAQVDLDAWGVAKLTRKDMIIPRILVMQPMSKLVVEKQTHAIGQLVDSLTSEVLGDIKKPLEFVPFFLQKIWVEYDMVAEPGKQKKKRVYRGMVPITQANENLPYEDVVSGQEVQRDRVMDFYVLLPTEIEKGNTLPYILSFRRSSAKAGQKLATTMFVKNIQRRLTPASVSMELSCAMKSNDEGTFVVMDVKEKRASSQEEVNTAFDWIKPIMSGLAKADESTFTNEGQESSFVEETGPKQF